MTSPEVVDRVRSSEHARFPGYAETIDDITGLLYATDLLPTVRPSLLIATGIVVLLSGLSLVGTVQDAITGYNVTAAGRTMEVALLTAGLIAGIALTLRAGVQLGVRTTVSLP